MRAMPLLILLLMLAGCAGGMGADECRTANWRAIGYEDGVQGQSPAFFGPRRKACAEHGVTADFDAYLAGRAEGLEHFCRPQNGFRLGRQGHAYGGICPLALEQAFVVAHGQGYGLYQRGLELDRIGKSLRHKQKRADEVEFLLAENTAHLIAPDLAPGERALLAVEIQQLTEERIELTRVIEQLEQDYALAELEYETYRRELAGEPGGYQS